MIGYILDPKTWAPVKTVTISSYELPLEVPQGETGKVSIAGKLGADYSRYIIQIGDFNYSAEYADYANLFKITGQETGDADITILTVSETLCLLEDMSVTFGNKSYRHAYLSSRDLYSPGDGYASLGLFVHGANSQPRKIPSEYSLGYTWFHGWSDLEQPLDDAMIPLTDIMKTDDGTYFSVNCEDLLRAIRQLGISYTFAREAHMNPELEKPSLCLGIRAWYFEPEVKQIVFGDGHNQLLSESYNDNVCSCVTVMVNGAYTANNVRYLTASGMSTEKDGQIKGYSTTILAQKVTGMTTAQVIDNAAAEEFLNNTYSHKIEFASDMALHIGQPVKLKLNRGILDTVISKVTKKSSDGRYYYTCGELPITVTERIKADGWSYGSRLPNNPYKGQLFLEV